MTNFFQPWKWIEWLKIYRFSPKMTKTVLSKKFSEKLGLLTRLKIYYFLKGSYKKNSSSFAQISYFEQERGVVLLVLVERGLVYKAHKLNNFWRGWSCIAVQRFMLNSVWRMAMNATHDTSGEKLRPLISKQKSGNRLVGILQIRYLWMEATRGQR